MRILVVNELDKLMPASNATDQDLLAGVTRGEHDAFHIFYHRHAAPLFRHALALSGRQDAAEDMVQEIFLGVIQSAERLENMEDMRGYMLKSVRNLWLNQIKKTQRERRAMADLTDTNFFQDAHVTDIKQTNMVERLNGAVARLPVEQREVIMLRNFNKMSFRAIAELLEEPLPTIASRHRLAIERLKRSVSGGD